MARVLKGGRRDELATDPPLIKDAPFDPKAEAERIIGDARQEAERLRAQAVVEGRERGLQAVTELLTAARAASVKAQRSVTEDLRLLAVRIAEKILERELTDVYKRQPRTREQSCGYPGLWPRSTAIDAA